MAESSRVNINRRMLDRAIGSRASGVPQAFEKIGKDAVRIARKRASGDLVEVRTDTYRRSLEYRLNPNGTGVTLQVGALQAKGKQRLVADIIEGGSKPHIIRPRNPNGVLIFTPGSVVSVGNRNGRLVVVAKEVRHPGTRPNYLVWNATMDALSRYARLRPGARR
jgi:hypothetical protein